MSGKLESVCGTKYLFDPESTIGRAGDDEDELVRFEGRFVRHDTILRNAHSMERHSENAQSAGGGGAFQYADDRRNERTADQDRADSGHSEERLPVHETPNLAPKSSELTPVLQAAAGAVVANDMILGTVVLADDGESVQIDPRAP